MYQEMVIHLSACKKLDCILQMIVDLEFGK
jgi:hypothetical protein